MSFVAPWFLLGLAAVAAPILIHLVRQLRRTPQPFPSLMFIQYFALREKQRLRLRDPWLLLLRCVLLILLALAFAQPYWPQPQQPLSDSDLQGRSVVIALDNSASMQAGSRWQDSQTKALALINDLQAQDRAAVLVFSDQVQLLAAMGADREALSTAVHTARPTDTATALAPALARAVQLLATESELQHAEIVLISDLQQSSLSDLIPLRLPDNVELILESVATEQTDNIALTAVDIHQQRDGERLLLQINAQIRNFGTNSSSARVALSIAEQPRDATTITLEPKRTTAVSFDAIPAPTETVVAAVQLQKLTAEQNQLKSDDHFWLLLHPPAQQRVLLITDNLPQPQQNLHLSQALSAVRSPLFELEPLPANELTPAALQNVDAVILNNTPVPSGVMGNNLLGYIENGGGLLIAAGANTRGEWPGAPITNNQINTDNWLPGRLGDVQYSNQALQFLISAERHPVFAQIDQAFAASQILRYRALESTRSDQVLARLSNGQPLLLERTIDQGKVMALAVPLDTDWSDLPLQPGFVPWLTAMMKYLSDYRPPIPYARTSTLLDVAQLAGAGAADYIVNQPNGQTLRLASNSAYFKPAYAGIHTLVNNTTDILTPIAINLPTLESDIISLTEQELLSRIQRTIASDLDPAAPQQTVSAQTQAYWWYILAILLFLLLVETFVSARGQKYQHPKPT